MADDAKEGAPLPSTSQQPSERRQEYRPGASPSYFEVDFNQTPFTLAWEITRACALKCLHCRAEAQPRRDPRELTTDEGLRFIDQVVEIGKPILVITGGDPMMRRDVYEFIGYGVGKGLRVALSPSATKLVTRPALQRAKDQGLHMVHVSLDGSSPEVHDAFRGFRGSYQRTVEILQDAQEVGLPVQIGTTVCRYNRHELPDIAERVAGLGVTVWNVFFLVPTGRGKEKDIISPQEHEDVFNWLYDLSKTAPFHVRTTAAQHYRRVVIQRTREALGQPKDAPSGDVQWGLTGAGYAFREGRAPIEKGVNDGSGFCFVSHTGEVFPSGFLQISGGNIREKSLAEIYRNSPVFNDLRNPEKLKGRCGVCQYKSICGGSRARAYYVTGDYLAEEPCCVYVPQPVSAPAQGGVISGG